MALISSGLATPIGTPSYHTERVFSLVVDIPKV